MSASRRRLRDLQRRHPEWEFTRTRGGHLRGTHPTGAVVIAAGTPSDSRSIKNTEARLRRAERRTA